ncbi:nuclease domain-containing protein 1 [Cryptococcus neoformans C23]|uniref:Staphylococcal nuclease domain-containing protein 1 n=1 Tax=Cryptococcus neoformans (strain H99 / ATCC 208821 / CBS 10515 / FGSC 9487) TaxID=235443 RepID=J9VFU9_CRYN9|nr:staphylococcal nuclease domain-containing protein 1 [Cryptococcus neoformans var. grubii H99]AUB22763.1 staphylococcal nuclease domain-containing protein 1 [Cryptococcus neoformans var. grubii]OWZ35468.1 nuclease domain-containing protein 1 [Cryptococcus neoformans var. grubii AD2-60a]OWZ47347.1 nuclease domain-containing protein 1 [Cryptococcus neoformans var. grubii C23]OXC86552.1 nuclease domain-containing protein 1 [Cryptococcus neoformans var. grubii AD1-7a]OXG38749.1 nuclease domain-c|eukprot:XP_012047203.1 staphylococcal nuclease domain-containing protein 1 [Cryptococcus neoformans var. grubii H99]
MTTRAIVKYVMSGDTVVVRAKEAPEKGKVPKERILHIAGIQAPRLGSMTREDETHAFSAREYLCSLLLGKEVAFTITHTIESSTGPNREFVSLCIAPAGPGLPPQDVASLIVAQGWAKMRDGVGEGDEAVRRLGAEEAKKRENLRVIEAQAKSEGKGIWDEQPENQRTVAFQMPTDPQAFITDHKDEEIDAIVEQVRDGTQLRVRLLLDEHNHQFINLVLAGAKSPRSGNPRGDGEASNAEPWGDEAKYFTEVRMLQRHIKVRLLSAPASLGASPLQQTQSSKGSGTGLPGANGLPAPSTGSTVIIGTAIHPKGNIAEFLLAAGLAKVVDWHVGLLAPYGGLDKLRAAEKAAKDKKQGIWENYQPQRATATNGAASATPIAAATTKGTDFEASVVRIWGSDQVSVVEKGEGGKERRVQLSSVRGPKGVDAKQTYWANEAKEFLRKRLIGKNVNVHVDYVKPKEGDFEERECVTIRYGNQNNNIAEQLIEKGLATVLRHRRDDEDRSLELDKLIVAEQTAQTEGRGVHSTKDVSMPRIVDASERASMASSYLPQWKRQGKHSAVVDFVSAGSRFKLYMPKEHTKVTFVLAGIRAPRTARNASEKPEPFGAESLKFASKYLQRDVEIAFDSTDRSGGFIGTMYASGGVNVAVELAREGLAFVHERSAELLPFGKELLAAEEQAKKEKKNIWSLVQEEETSTTAAVDESSALPVDYKDVYISSVKESEPFTFSVQILEKDSVAALEKLMSDFSLHHRQASAATSSFTPKAGDLVSAKFSKDDRWYRARVKRASAIKKEAQVYLIDYGDEDTVPFSKIRPLDEKFKSLPGQAKEARLSFVKLVPRSSEYGPEAYRRFEYLTEGLKLIANIDQREGNLLHLRLIDPADPNIKEDPLACLNADLVREGLATIDKSCKYLSSYPQIIRKLQDAGEGAKADRLGIFEFGDVSED